MKVSAGARKRTARKGRASRPYWAYRAALAAILCVAFLAFAVSVRDGNQGLARNEAKFPHEGSALAAYSISEGVAQLLRNPLFPYSVIPGGAHSAQELKNAVAHDAVVASHYADFDLTKVHIVPLDRDRMAYVSYRLGDRVYWTRKKLALPKGEKIITDGKHEARTRCGNRISETPAEPVSAQEPTEEAMEAAPALDRFPGSDPPVELPVASPPLPTGPLQTPPENPPGWVLIPPSYPIVGGDPPLTSPPPVEPPVATPEPDTWVLLVMGVLVCASFGVRARMRKKRQA